MTWPEYSKYDMFLKHFFQRYGLDIVAGMDANILNEGNRFLGVLKEYNAGSIILKCLNSQEIKSLIICSKRSYGLSHSAMLINYIDKYNAWPHHPNPHILVIKRELSLFYTSDYSKIKSLLRYCIEMGSTSMFQTICEKVLRYYSELFEITEGLANMYPDLYSINRTLPNKIIGKLIKSVSLSRPHLSIAIASTHMQNAYIVDCLLKYVCNPNFDQTTYMGLNIFEIMILTSNASLIRQLIHLELLPNLKEEELTKLMICCVHADNKEIMAILIKHYQIPINAKCYQLVLFESIRKNKYNTFKFLIKTVAPFIINKEVYSSHVLLWAFASATPSKFIQSLLRVKGININVSDKYGKTALHIACIKVHL
jgi:hypothetical protein